MNMPSLRLVWRGLRQRIGFTVAVVLTLGSGFAVAIAMFSALYGVALKPLQYPDAEQLVTLSTRDEARGLAGNPLSGAEIDSDLGSIEGIEAVGVLSWSGATALARDGRPQVLTGARVGAQFFDVFHRPALLGRTLGAADVGTDRMVLGHAAWETLTGADPQVIGRSLRFEGFSAQIVGVMPPDFDVPAAGMGFWSSLDLGQVRADPVLYQNARYFTALARLSPGVSLAQARSALQRHSVALARQQGAPAGSWTLDAAPLRDSVVSPSLRPVLLALLLVALLVLLIATGNVVNLLIARGLARLNELAVHQALGATLGRVRRMLLLEAGTLVLLAAGLGVGLAWLGLKLWIGLTDSGLPRTANIAIDLPVLGFAVLAALVVLAMVAGLPLLPLERATRTRQLRARGAGQAQIGWIGVITRGLPAAGVALSTGALATAAVLGLSAQRLSQQDLGFDTEHVAAAHGFSNASPTDLSALRQFANQLVEQGRASGATQVALISSPPLSTVGAFPMDVKLPGQDQSLPLQPLVRTVQGDIVQALGLQLQLGRALAETDREGSVLVAMVNENFARQAFAGADPLGKVIRIPPFGRSGEMLEFQIVGVFADIRAQEAGSPAEPEIWLPFSQYPNNSMALVARGGLAAEALVQTLQEAFWRVDPQQGIYRAYTMRSQLDAQLATPRFFARNAGSFAMLALVLGTVGIYGVVAFDLAQRRRDLALRAALGANTRALGRWILQRGVFTLALGLSVGVVLGWSLIGLVRSQLFGVADTGPTALLAAAALVSVATLSVCVWLARQAGRTDPMFVLRHD